MSLKQVIDKPDFKVSQISLVFTLDECFKYNSDFYGDDLSGEMRSGVSSAEKCQKICQVNKSVYWLNSFKTKHFH